MHGWRISTHALTWSATQSADRLSGWRKISTHALTWSATWQIAATVCTMQFQLTHSRGVRRCVILLNRLSNLISTHALTWSATCVSTAQRMNRRHFNSRTHVECDYRNGEEPENKKISTHALTWSATRISEQEVKTAIISTHALTWSATI